MLQQEITVSADFPYQSHYVDILDTQLHYIDEGEGQPILFLHGIPTSGYVWRNIIPSLTDKARCIVPDLVGMGKSGKPDIAYTIFDHIRYIDAFIEKLGLKKITLVMHAWGSVIGFDYARRHEKNVRAMAFFEAHVRPITEWNSLSLPVQELASIMHQPDQGYDLVTNKNYFIKTVLPSGILRSLSPKELSHYQSPFTAPNSAKPLWQYANDFPLGDGPKEVIELMNQYSKWLCKTTLPKLMLYSIPGYLTTIDTVQWARENILNIKVMDAGDALHYPQEDNPEQLSSLLGDWYTQL